MEQYFSENFDPTLKHLIQKLKCLVVPSEVLQHQ